ncbi:MFS transporter [Gulosibacter chungangensis]|uniref:MFS transporter n=1 Tax=Gulosibacter chungangensis TaxID=979746 RepID=A0A7J5BGB3_9MICO|nr:MFS transporter [Gulosibacter chungangensis]KAB1645331.1 MFS transporter [Gulosibacter chungangensis]
MNNDPGYSLTGSTWIGHRRGTGPYARIQLAMLLAGIATFAQLYAPQALLPQIADAFSVSIADSSLMISMGTAGLAIAVVPWSLVADRIGRKRTISIAVVAATLLGLLSTAMPNFELTLAMRFLEGLALGGVPAVAMAYINEEIHRSDAAAAGGTFVAGNTIGGLSGRIISGPVGEATGSWEVGFLVVAGLSILASILFMVITPQPQGFIPMGGTGSTMRQSVQFTLSNSWQHLKNPVLIALYTQPFLLLGGFVAVYNYLGYHLTEAPFFLPVWVSSLVFLAYLAGTVSSPPAGRLAGKYGRKRVMLITQVITWASLGIMLIPNLIAIIAGLILFTAAFFGSHSTASGWAGAYPKFGRAQSTALYNLSYYIGSSILGYVGGLFFQQWGWVGLTAMVGSLFLIAFVIASTMLPGRPKEATRQHP